MEKMNMYSFTNFLMESVNNGHSITLGTMSGENTGVVTHIDTQGPFPSVFLKHPKADNGVGTFLSQVNTFRMASAEHQPMADEGDEFDKLTKRMEES